jgi:hypothetical protein
MAVTFNIKLEGFDKAVQKMDLLKSKLVKYTNQGFKFAVQELVYIFKTRTTPVGQYKGGSLRRSIRAFFNIASRESSAEIKMLKYALYLELGTSEKPILPVYRKALMWRVRGMKGRKAVTFANWSIWRTRSTHKATLPKPFIVPTVREWLPRGKQYIYDYLQQAVSETART